MISLWACLGLGAPLLAEKGPREWEEELEKRYRAGSGYWVSYKGTSPDKEGTLKVDLGIEQSGAGMMRVAMRVGPDEKEIMSMVQIPAGQDDPGLFIKMVPDQKKVVRNLEEEIAAWKDALQAVWSVLFNAAVKEGKGNGRWVGSAYFKGGKFHAGMSFQSDDGPSWLEEGLTSSAEKVVVKEKVVEFVLPNGGLVAVDRETGIMVEQVAVRETGKAILKAESLRKVKSFAEFAKMLPVEDWSDAEEISLSESPMGDSLRILGTQFMMAGVAHADHTMKDLDERLKKAGKAIENYWLVLSSDTMRALVPKRKVRLLRGGLLGEYDKFKGRHPQEAKKLDFQMWLEWEREMVEGLFRSMMAQSDYMKTLRAELGAAMKAPDDADPETAAKLGLFAEAYMESALMALARVVTDEVMKDE